jgi:predicted acylesterase/phospholipase RssA
MKSAIDGVRDLGLEESGRYHVEPGAAWLRWTPSAADRMARAEPEMYEEYIRRSCDVTMRGGTTSGVVYPLAVCALAEHYMFRSVGGASAGAIGAATTAAAEYGRYAEPVEPVAEGAVRPGFAGLAGMIRWLVSGTGDARWRLPQLFQPKASLHKMFRLVMALMQGEGTGRGRFLAVLVAMLFAVKPMASVVLVALFLAWVAGPYAVRWLLPPEAWNGTQWIVAVVLAAVALAAAVWVVRIAVARLGGKALFLVTPLVIGFTGVALYRCDLSAWLVAGAILVAVWLLLTAAVLAFFAVIYGKASWPVLANFRKHRFGLVPGAEPYTPTWIDRLAGMPRSTGVPPLASWLADRIDDLAGIDHERALTFGDLWQGPGERRAGVFRPNGERVINLALMTTDLSAGRPHQLPFQDAAGWQFCPECLADLVPDRIVRQMRTSIVDGAMCPAHPAVALYWLPPPADMPVVLAVRMSLPMPALICPVPLYLDGRPHWFSDGGITSNFPIHFFDSLLPRWPTFGLNLESQDRVREPGEIVEPDLPEQDASTPRQPYTDVGPTVVNFFGRILDTFLDWRDTMQAGLPGFRGRIATIPQVRGEGGMNLFMRPEVIATLALRGHAAGTLLKHRFTAQYRDEAEGFTRTDRYRWIRMRLALREYHEVAVQANARTSLYEGRASRYPIPAAMAGWFHGPHRPPMTEPFTAQIDGTFDGLIQLSVTHLAEKFDGTAPVDPVMRLTPPE